jgi:hypothetical protein
VASSSIPGGQQTGVPVGLLLVEMVLPARIPPRILTARTLYCIKGYPLSGASLNVRT